MPLNLLTRKRLLFFIKLLGGVGILYWLLQKLDWEAFAFHLEQIAWPLLLLLISFSICDRFIMAYKWNLLLRANGLTLSTHRVMALYLVSNLLGSFTPGNLGGDAYRVMALAPYGKNAAVLSTVLLERAAGLLALLLFVIVALPFSFTLFGAEAETVAGVAIGGAAIILLMMFMPLYRPLRECVNRLAINRPSRGAKKIHQLFCAYAEQHRNRFVLAMFFGLTLAETGFFFFRNFLAIHASGVDVSLAYVFMIMPMVHFILRLPISIQGIGLQEGLFAYALSLAGYTLEQGIIVSFVWRLTDILAVYLPATLLLLLFPIARPASNSIPDANRNARTG
jgi:glycosyltransferase 2 family protein